jgi:hypothetical protein
MMPSLKLLQFRGVVVIGDSLPARSGTDNTDPVSLYTACV